MKHNFNPMDFYAVCNGCGKETDTICLSCSNRICKTCHYIFNNLKPPNILERLFFKLIKWM